jgi:hypothetical protein
MTAKSTPTEILRAYIEQEGVRFHLYVVDDGGAQWHTPCHDATTMAEAIVELEDCAWSWGYSHLKLWGVDHEVSNHPLPTTDARIGRLAKRKTAGSVALEAKVGTLPEGAFKWCQECVRWVAAPHACPLPPPASSLRSRIE